MTDAKQQTATDTAKIEALTRRINQLETTVTSLRAQIAQLQTQLQKR